MIRQICKRTATTAMRNYKQFSDQKSDSCVGFLGSFDTTRSTSPPSFLSCVWKIFKCRTRYLLADLFLRILVGPIQCDQSFPHVKRNRTAPPPPCALVRPRVLFFFLLISTTATQRVFVAGHWRYRSILITSMSIVSVTCHLCFSRRLC